MKKLLCLFYLLVLFFIVSCTPPPEKVTNLLGMNFVYIKPGKFMMGKEKEFRSTELKGYEDTYKEVEISDGFYLQTTEVTIGQWKQFIEDTNYKTEAEDDSIEFPEEVIFYNRSYSKLINGYYWNKLPYSQTDEHPVTCLSNKDIQMFLNWLNKKDGNYYRLPTEEEWEYAARAGTITNLPNGNLRKIEQEDACLKSILDEIGWYCYNSGNTSHPVSKKKPNSWGLYDMHGNVEEVVEKKKRDVFIVKGGSWVSFSKGCISGNSHSVGKSTRANKRGLRIIRELSER